MITCKYCNKDDKITIKSFYSVCERKTKYKVHCKRCGKFSHFMKRGDLKWLQRVVALINISRRRR